MLEPYHSWSHINDKFFKTALPLTVERLEIVYTPVEVVDFILRSVDDVLQKNFEKTLSDRNIYNAADTERFDSEKGFTAEISERIARERDSFAGVLHSGDKYQKCVS